jgi:drug/metabolite transporter (DMT)-like permease
MEGQKVSKRGWVLFAAMGVIWGIPYLLIKVAVDEIAPSTLVLARTAIAALLLMPVALARGQVRAVLPRWKPLALFAVVEICLPWLMLGFAEQQISSSLTGLLIAAVPLVGALLAHYGPVGEALDRRRVAGLLLGLAGVAALVGFEVQVDDVRAVVAIGVVAIAYAVGPLILSRHLADLPGTGVMAFSLLLSAVIYLPAGIAQAPDHWPSGKVIASIVGLAVVCTAIAFLVFFALVAEVGPARATVITYVNPAVALLLGVVILDESFTVATGVGFGLILLGSVLATSRDRGEPRRRTSSRLSWARAHGADIECADLATPVGEP